MATYSGATQQVHPVKLTSAIELVMWGRPVASPGGSISLDVFTRFVGNGAEMEITITDQGGKTLGQYKEKLYANRFSTAVQVPAEARAALYAAVKLPRHGLSLKSEPLLLIEPVMLSGARWSASEAHRGDLLTLTADVRNAPDGAEVTVEIWEHDSEGAHRLVTSFPTLVDNGRVEATWEFEYQGDDTIPTQEELELGAPDHLLAEYFFTLRIGGVKAQSTNLKFKEPHPTVKPAWSAASVIPDHNTAFPPASPPTDTVPAAAKVTLQVETAQVPDGTAAVITIHHCHTKSLLPGGEWKGLLVQSNKVVDPATGKPPIWTVKADHLPWDSWDKPFLFFKVQVAHRNLKAATPDDYQKKEAKTLRVVYWHACISDAIADTPAGGKLTTRAEMKEIADLLEGHTHHKVYRRAVNQANVPVNLWGSLLRNTYAYHHASHGDIVDRTTGAQLNAPGNPPIVPFSNWRSVVVLGSTSLGDVEVKRVADVPSVPRYLVYMDTCVAGWEKSLGQAFIARGTRNYLAFRCYIPDGDARKMARSFYRKWGKPYKFDPSKIPAVFFDVGAPYYKSMRPVLMGAGGGAIESDSSFPLLQSLAVIGTAIGGVAVGIAFLLKKRG